MSELLKLNRRAFLIRSALAGGGLLVGFHLPAARKLAAEPLAAPAGDQPVEVNAWIMIQPDDSVVVRVARSEMGQGVFTALPMLVAEELGCDWNRVRAEYVTANTNLRRNNVFQSMSTGGSRSIRGSQEYLRTAGAVARELLVAAAARRWGVPADECQAENSVITHTTSGRTLGFGAVAAEAASLPPPEAVFLKEPDEWRLLGKPVKRLDVPDKIAGKPVFGTDVEVPGMLHAAIHACPVFGGRLQGFDASAIEKRPGIVQVVALDDAVAVVAESWWQAQQALQALPVTWDEAGHGKVDDAAIRSNLEAGLDVDDAVVVAEHGKPVAAFQAAERQVEATFFAPYLAHATMEPMTCTAAVYKDGRVEVWVPTQNATASLQAAARTAGVDPLQVEVHNTQLGGGFGRRGANQDFTIQAVRIARAVGRPVKLMWSREEDTRHDFYRPASMARLRAALNREGRLTGMTVRVSAPSILTSLGMKQDDGHDPIALAGFADTFYAIPSLRADYAMRRLHVPIGFWRSVNHSQNAYFREHFLDQVAHAAGQDPYTFRLGLPRRARGGRRTCRLGQAITGEDLARHRRGDRLRQPLCAGRGAAARGRQALPAAARGLCHRHRARGQSRHHRRAGGERDHLRPDGGPVRRDHHRRWSRAAGQLRRLPDADPAADARGGDAPRSQRRFLGRRWRAAPAAHRPGVVQRPLCGHRQAHSFAATERPRTASCLKRGYSGFFLL
jgi:isoquinoline 1-oxidoreductase beta subunit